VPRYGWIYGYTEGMAKILVSLDDRLLERLDREAAARGMSRSALIAELAAKGLGHPLGPGARPEVREALRSTRQLFADVKDPVDSTQIVRELRDSR
jgi:hypothetical protein